LRLTRLIASRVRVPTSATTSQSRLDRGSKVVCKMGPSAPPLSSKVVK
jgi:hypothetical protein